MLRVGLSGGIGSGKSTVSARLAELGAVVVDADAVAREVVAAGTPGLGEIVDRFGVGMLTPDGALDRTALGQVVFDDPQARQDLERITHPRIRARSAELFADAPADAVVVHDIPLLVELDLVADYALTVIVDVDAAERERRLVQLRGMPSAQARARIAAQADDAARAAAADVLLDNRGTVAELLPRVDALWHDRLVPFERGLRAGVPSRRPERLSIVDPDPDWPHRARRLLARVRTALGESVLRADHVGSTSVPGLPAKDVIDLQVVVADLGVLDDPTIRTALARVGLLVADGGWFDHGHPAVAAGAHRPTLPKRMVKTADPAQVVHCHVRPVGSQAWELALLFRDWMNAEVDERAAYVELKLRHLSAGTSASDYAQQKEPWFASAFERAQDWAVATGWSLSPGPTPPREA
ncbi:dephospho-CoA kinase [Serinicoccus sp. LYQ131]|uniref:dephospho-CoA kinase n=1 Tax=Serinicoccus sp. LYQ131 TaxID=3378797 RepID=UPI003851E334